MYITQKCDPLRRYAMYKVLTCLFFVQQMRLYMNLFIESIEGGMYIAGIGSDKATSFLKDSYRNSPSFQSITDIREQVSGQHFDKIFLKQNTPYDEMCGSAVEDDKLMIELEWR